MAYNLGYTGSIPTQTTNSIGYSSSSNNTTIIPTSASTGTTLATVSPPGVGVWLAIGNVKFNPKANSGNNYYGLSLSTTAGTFDSSFCFIGAVNTSNNNVMPFSFQVRRVFIVTSTKSTMYLIFNTSTGASSSSGNYNLQYIRLA